MEAIEFEHEVTFIAQAVIDLDSGRIVWVARGRGGDTLRKFWRALRLSKARIEAVASMTEINHFRHRIGQIGGKPISLQ